MKDRSSEALCCFQFFYRLPFFLFEPCSNQMLAGNEHRYLKRICFGIRDKSQHLLLNFHDTLKLSLLVINGANNAQEEMGKDNQRI
jgi:hypothetical protein